MAVPEERRQVTPTTLEPLAAHFGDEPRAYRSPHFVLLYDVEPWQARMHVLLLERTHAQFYEVFGQGDFALRPLGERLVCLLFAEQADFVDYGRAADGMDLSWTGGYYSARTNRVALFQRGWPEQQPDVVDAEPAMALVDREREADQPTLRFSALEPAASDHRADGLASTVHEAAHQLAFNSGLQSRGVMYPLWVSEGLAISFETQNPSKAFGPAYINEPRRADLRVAREAGRLMELEQFVSLVRPPVDDAAMVRAVYAQAWALFHHLYNHEPKALRGYLGRLADLPPGRRSAHVLRREFVSAFGPLEQFGDAWQAHLVALTAE
ncbi:DUF1570 domain-containing protein [Phycisphaerales bacterium AB-hyl4]|uniref:DUF1570 domain-containing protein n=1 Tax=Natronomicrosphaera hydrolytica TaxID=3242702 RepID=A0ABV4U6X1_9BACT